MESREIREGTRFASQRLVQICHLLVSLEDSKTLAISGPELESLLLHLKYEVLHELPSVLQTHFQRLLRSYMQTLYVLE